MSNISHIPKHIKYIKYRSSNCLYLYHCSTKIVATINDYYGIIV